MKSNQNILTQNQPASAAAFIGTKKWESRDIIDLTIESANLNGHSSHMSSKDVEEESTERFDWRKYGSFVA